MLNSLVPTPEAALRQITTPTLVAIGDQDERSDADELAALLHDARFVRVPGDHGSAFAAPELAAAVAAFLAERCARDRKEEILMTETVSPVPACGTPPASGAGHVGAEAT